tara:strand:+ start:408 stop:548 length:141 start_codon:yes stop_codon:yes gene_type:complete
MFHAHMNFIKFENMYIALKCIALFYSARRDVRIFFLKKERDKNEGG